MNTIDLVKIFVSILVLPITVIILILMLVVALQFAVHETLWEHKESKD